MQNEPTTSSGRGAGAGQRTEALGEVARDVIDHVVMIARDGIKIGTLEARRYGEHLRRDVGWKAGFGAMAGVTGIVALLCGLIAIFLGIANALGSVAWAFAIYCGAFFVAAITLVVLAARPPRRDEGEEIARRFPSARTKESMPEHLLIAQRSSRELHRRATEEAAREATVRP